MSKVYINGNEYELKRAPLYNSNTLEIHFEGYSEDIDFSNGVSLIDPADEELNDFIKEVEGEDAEKDIYKYKWNILTPLEDGIVLSKVEGYVETEDNRLFVPTQEQLDMWDKEHEENVRETRITKADTDQRITDLEDLVCSLYDIIDTLMEG